MNDKLNANIGNVDESFELAIEESRTGKILYFIRHAESSANAGGVSVEHSIIPLSEKGVEQAQALVNTLQIIPSQVLVSAFDRTHQTSAPYCRHHNKKAIIEPLLNEFSALSFELIEGMQGSERRQIADAYWAEADIYKRMGNHADTFAEFDARVQEFKNNMYNLQTRTVIVGHGIWFGLLLWHLIGFKVENSKQMKAFRRFQNGLPLHNTVIYKLTMRATNDYSFRIYEQGL